MSKHIINSDATLSHAIGWLRDEYHTHRYIEVSLKAGTDRSLSQNALSHAWYQQVATELREDTPLGVKSFCKLVFGVPILRAEDDEYRATYDATIKRMTYEQKLEAMKCWPVTSLMTKAQLSAYLEAMQEHYANRVDLKFPDTERKDV